MLVSELLYHLLLTNQQHALEVFLVILAPTITTPVIRSTRLQPRKLLAPHIPPHRTLPFQKGILHYLPEYPKFPQHKDDNRHVDHGTRGWEESVVFLQDEDWDACLAETEGDQEPTGPAPIMRTVVLFWEVERVLVGARDGAGGVEGRNRMRYSDRERNHIRK
jgi:hypothetical protein